jgi:DNA polymerase-3 subunit alpha
MSEPIFSHLHVHTEYSLLCGVSPLAQLYKEAPQRQVKAVAMTDRGNMFGTVDFYTKFNGKESKTKGIIGCEVYFIPQVNAQNRTFHHLVLLAENEVGYQNLKKIVSKAYLDENYYLDIPHVDLKLLEAHSEGLIVLSGGVRGIIERAIMEQKEQDAIHWALTFQRIFGKDHFFLEVQAVRSARHQKINIFFRKLNQEHQISICATNESFYLSPTDAISLEVLTCIASGTTLDGHKDEYSESNEYYFKSAQEVIDVLGEDFADAIDNTNAIADRCQLKITLGKIFLPTYQVPDGFTLDTYLKHRAFEGLKERFEEFRLVDKQFDQKEYEDRLEMELGVIIRMQFPGYFLIVQDFINWAKQNDIPVGPGRGSGAGSLAAYALRITDFDPIPYGLLFERFLNPERVSMPDFDVDFCQDRRVEVIQYVTRKYGKLNVGQIATFGALKAKGVIKDVGRALGLPISETDTISKLIQDQAENLEQAIDLEPRLKNISQDPKNEQLFFLARKLEGLNRNVGMHAAGVVIGDEPLWHYCPIFKGGNGELVTQFAKDEVEKAGLVKFDFLGLKTLTVIQDAVKLINRNRKPADHIDINTLRLTDEPTYQLISSGETENVFQLESTGFQGLLKKLKPDCFEDIIAAVALYRPGPLNSGMLDTFINRKHGIEAIEYDHPLLKTVLKETYGVIVYQEQVMQIAQILADFTLGGADLLRRAMGKKKMDEMMQQRANFASGAAKKDISQEKAMAIFDLMEKFAEYGFNKSHSAAYALLTYQTGYLKRHFPAEFMASVLTNDRAMPDKVSKGVGNAQNMGIRVLPPHINQSLPSFDVVGKDILFGLNGIKGVGDAAVEAILDARKDGPFKSFSEFFQRVDLRRVNKKVVETLIQAGAFDCFKIPRQRLFKATEKFIAQGQLKQRDEQMGQMNLLDMMMGGSETKNSKKDEEDAFKEFNHYMEWSKKELLAFEKNTLGFYVSGHPLDHFRQLTDHIKGLSSIHSIGKNSSGDEVIVLGIIVENKTIKTSHGNMGIIRIEDRTGSIEVILTEDLLNQHYQDLSTKDPVIVLAKVSVPRDEGKETALKAFSVKANDKNQGRSAITKLYTYFSQKMKKVVIAIKEDEYSQKNIDQLAKTLKSNEYIGNCQLEFSIVSESKIEYRFLAPFSIGIKEQLYDQIKKLIPTANIMFMEN